MRTIKNNKEYQEALKLVNKLMDKDPQPNTPEGKKLKLLATLVQNYEKNTFDGDYKPTLWENIWWPIEGFLEKVFRDFPNEIKWFIQRGKRGYADCDVWSLDWYLLGWLPKAIRQLRDTTHSYPTSGITPREWGKVLTKMANGLESGYKLGEEYGLEQKVKKLKKEFNEGFKLFQKWFWNLWD